MAGSGALCVTDEVRRSHFAISLSAIRLGFGARAGFGAVSRNRPVSFYLFVYGTQQLAHFVYAIAIAAGRGVGGYAERGGNLLESKALPKFQVNHGALVFRQFRQGAGKGFAKGGHVRVCVRGENR